MLESAFSLIVEKWLQETAAYSSMSKKMKNIWFKKIVSFGKNAIIPCLENLASKKPGHWYLVLEEITGIDPLPQESSGTISEIKQSWITWGIENGYLKQ